MRPSTIWASQAALSRRAPQVRLLWPPHPPGWLYRPGDAVVRQAPRQQRPHPASPLTRHPAGGMAASRHRRSVGEADLLCHMRLAQGRHPGGTTSSPSR